MAPRIDHPRFIALLTERFPEPREEPTLLLLALGGRVGVPQQLSPASRHQRGTLAPKPLNLVGKATRFSSRFEPGLLFNQVRAFQAAASSTSPASTR